MNVAFLHTIPYRYEINNLIDDILSNVKDADFHACAFPCLWSSGSFFKKLFALRKFVINNKINVIHVYDYVDAYFVLKVTVGIKIKIVFSDYDYHDELKGYRKIIYKKILKKVHHLVCQSESHKKYVTEAFCLSSEKCSKLYHAFCFKRFDNFEYKSVRDEFFIDDFRYLIGTIGDFAPQRDMMSIFKMVKKLRRTGRNFTCVIAGDQVAEHESYYNSCKYYYLLQGLDNYITYIGRREDDANLLSQLDLFVYNTNRETIALPVIEAMVSGVNVVANNNDMMREISFNGKYMFLYEENNETDFSTKVREVLQNLEDNKLIAQVVKEETRQIFSINRHILGLKNIYNKITN